MKIKRVERHSLYLVVGVRVLKGNLTARHDRLSVIKRPERSRKCTNQSSSIVWGNHFKMSRHIRNRYFNADSFTFKVKWCKEMPTLVSPSNPRLGPISQASDFVRYSLTGWPSGIQRSRLSCTSQGAGRYCHQLQAVNVHKTNRWVKRIDFCLPPIEVGHRYRESTIPRKK